MKLLDLFSGIGGFSLGLERAGFETVAFCEIEDYPRKVLAKHWPNIPIAGDIRKLTYKNGELIYDGQTIYRGTIDAICGGFPCQDISVAGNQKGIQAERSGLWSELHRLISEIRPKYAIVENVTALLSGDSGRWFQRVLGDLAEIRFNAEWHCISASELGAHHHRDRVWIICYPEHIGRTTIEIGESNQTGNGSNATRQKPACEFERPSDSEILGHPKKLHSNERESNRKNSSAQIPELRESNSVENVADTDSASIKRGRISERIQSQYHHAICSSGWAIEPKLGRAFDGFPLWLDGCVGKGMNYDESKREVKILRSLWNINTEKTLQRATRGLERMEKAETLFFVLREYEKGTDEAWLLLEGEEVSDEYVRSLWLYGKSTSTSYRPEHQAQYEREYSDIVQELSRFLAHSGKEGWEISGWEDAIARVKNGTPDRPHRLKGLGNAVVPPIPELIGRAIMSHENEIGD